MYLIKVDWDWVHVAAFILAIKTTKVWTLGFLNASRIFHDTPNQLAGFYWPLDQTSSRIWYYNSDRIINFDEFH